jgi:uncharacterized OB-fold protein
MPAPLVDAYTHPWWQACTEHRLTAQHCRQCHHAQIPPAPICSECNSSDLELVTLNGRGILYSYTAVHQTLPFIIAVVELDVGGTACKNSVRLMTNIVDAEPAALRIDDPVLLVWETISEYVSIPRFKLIK